jgi:hypothetical protein
VLRSWSRKLVTAALCVVALPVLAQTTSKATLEANETLFGVTAAISHCGYGGDSGDEVRREVLADIARAVEASPAAQQASAEMCGFYRDHKQADRSRDLAQYVSLALNMGEPPQYELKLKEADLPPDANYVLGLIPLLKQFAAAVDLHAIWTKHQYEYDQMLAVMHVPVTRMLLSTDVYLRMPISGYVGRAFAIYLEPMVGTAAVNARNYGADFYLVLSTAGNDLHLDEIRHTYLHFVLDPLVLKRTSSLKQLAPLLPLVQTAPLDDSYKNDIGLLVTESLIKAVEARLSATGKANEAARQRRADEAMGEGFILTRYFYDQLAKFETGEVGLKDALPEWFYALDVGHERKVAENTQWTQKAPEEVVARKQPGPLDLAEQRLAAGDIASAQKLAQQALDQKQGDEGRALFLLAQAASLNRDMPGARAYFERTLKATRDPRLVAWSHIYLGRIADLQAERDEAVAHYQAALQAGDTRPQTKAAAERGLKEPYQPPQAAQKKEEKE